CVRVSSAGYRVDSNRDAGWRVAGLFGGALPRRRADWADHCGADFCGNPDCPVGSVVTGDTDPTETDLIKRWPRKLDASRGSARILNALPTRRPTCLSRELMLTQGM